MLLGDRDVEIAIGEPLGELDQAGALAHRRRDGNDARIALRHVAQPLAEDLRVSGTGALLLEDRAAHRVERPRPMPLDRVGFGGWVALALARHDVQQLRSAQLADVAQRADQRLDVVTVHGPDVVEPHLLEQRAGQHHALQMLFRAARQLPHRGHLPQHLLAALAQVRVHPARERTREVIGKGADVLRDRHVVVVEDHEQVRGQ